MSIPRKQAMLAPNEMALVLIFRETRSTAYRKLTQAQTRDDQNEIAYWDAVVTAILEQEIET